MNLSPTATIHTSEVFSLILRFVVLFTMISSQCPLISFLLALESSSL